jgi:hypothetical protein
MTPTMRKVLASLVPVICPPEALELGIGDELVAHVALQTSVLPPLMSRGLAAGMLTYDLGAIPFHRRRAHKLPRHLAQRYFESWLRGPTGLQRQLAIAIKQLLALAHYEHPLVQERMGYRPTQWIEKVKRRRLEVYQDDIAKHQASLLAPDPLPGVRYRKKARA